MNDRQREVIQVTSRIQARDALIHRLLRLLRESSPSAAADLRDLARAARQSAKETAPPEWPDQEAAQLVKASFREELDALLRELELELELDPDQA